MIKESCKLLEALSPLPKHHQGGGDGVNGTLLVLHS